MEPVVAWVAARMKEPSTWAGGSTIIAGALTYAGLPHDATTIQTISSMGMMLGGVLATILPEAKSA